MIFQVLFPEFSQQYIDMFTCHFCNNEYKTQPGLVKHQKTTKFCLKIQRSGKNPKPVTSEKRPGKNTTKNTTTDTTTDTTEIDALRAALAERDQEITRLNGVVFHQEKDLMIKLSAQSEEITRLKTKVKDLKKSHLDQISCVKRKYNLIIRDIHCEKSACIKVLQKFYGSIIAKQIPTKSKTKQEKVSDGINPGQKDYTDTSKEKHLNKTQNCHLSAEQPAKTEEVEQQLRLRITELEEEVKHLNYYAKNIEEDDEEYRVLCDKIINGLLEKNGTVERELMAAHAEIVHLKKFGNVINIQQIYMTESDPSKPQKDYKNYTRTDSKEYSGSCNNDLFKCIRDRLVPDTGPPFQSA